MRDAKHLAYTHTPPCVPGATGCRPGRRLRGDVQPALCAPRPVLRGGRLSRREAGGVHNSAP
eukprot:6105938-Prymnesium_polylepis.1